MKPMEPAMAARISALTQRSLRTARRRARAAADAMLRPGVVVVALLAAGSGCAIAGVLMLAGQAWALIAAAALLFAFAALLLRGLANG